MKLIDGHDAIEHAEVNGESREFIRKMMDYLEDAETVEPCKDAISREDVIKIIDRMKDRLQGNGCTYEFMRQMMSELPSVTVEPKQGEWIDKGWKGDWQFETDGRGNCWHEYECSECGFIIRGSKSNFCPNCGARMFAKDTNVPNKEGADE